MNLEKIKPWNWFKHEENIANQIPISNNGNPSKFRHPSNRLAHAKANGVDSLLQLHQEMNQLFDNIWNSFTAPTGIRFNQSTSALRNSFFDQPMLGDYHANLDVAGSEKEYEVSIDLPGLSEEDIEIELNGDTLIVKGQKQAVHENKDKQYYCVERSFGSFQRTLSLPEDADSEAITANIKNGLLIIKIPRKSLPKSETKRIEITS